MSVRPDEMVGVAASVLARLVWNVLVLATPDSDGRLPPKLNAAVMEALFALDLDTNMDNPDLARLMT